MFKPEMSWDEFKPEFQAIPSVFLLGIEKSRAEVEAWQIISLQILKDLLAEYQQEVKNARAQYYSDVMIKTVTF